MRKKDYIEMLLSVNKANIDIYAPISENDIDVITSMTLKRLDEVADIIIFGYVELAKVIKDDDLAQFKSLQANIHADVEDLHDFLQTVMHVKYDM